LTGIRVFQERA